jgi:hypothetical protein
MSKLNRSEFKELLTEWKQNFINEFRDTSKKIQKYSFDPNKKKIKKDDGGGLPPLKIGNGGGGGGGGRTIYATYWHDMIRLSLIGPQENEVNVESEDYVDPSIEDPSHFFFDQKKYTYYLDNQENLERDYHDYMIDLQIKAIHNIVPISKKGNISDNNCFMAIFFPESSYKNYSSYRLKDALSHIAENKTDNRVSLKFIPKSKEMSDLLKIGKGVFSKFNKESFTLLIDSIDSRKSSLNAPDFYMSTMSEYLKGISPFNFSTNREEDIEALHKALSYIIEECDLAYDLGVEIVKEGYSFNQHENELDEFDTEDIEETLENNLNFLYKTLNGVR